MKIANFEDDYFAGAGGAPGVIAAAAADTAVAEHVADLDEAHHASAVTIADATGVRYGPLPWLTSGRPARSRAYASDNVEGALTEIAGAIRVLGGSGVRYGPLPWLTSGPSAVVPGSGTTSSAPGDTTSHGTSADYSRTDHRHGREGYATTAEIADVASTESAGTSATVARGDHQHALGIGTTKGDLIAWTASGPTRQAVGADGTALIASSASATGLTWAVPFRAQGVHVRLTTDQTIAHTTETTVVYQTVDRDDSADISYDTGTGIFTIATPGWYLITAAAIWAASSTGIRWHGILVNGAYRAADRRLAASYSENSIVTALYLAANDQVSVRVYQDSGGNLALNASFARTRCSVVRIG